MGVAPLAVTGRAMWFLTRGSGAVTLVLLTASVVLGIVNWMRWGSRPRWPRFVLDALHRNARITALEGTSLQALVSSGGRGSLALQVDLQIDEAGGVTGTLEAAPQS